MDDSTAFDLISAYALNALSKEERASVESLLARSEEASALLADYQAMLDGMARLVPARTAPSGSSDKFAERLKRSEPIKLTGRRPTMVQAFALLAALLIVVFGGVFAFQAIQRQTEAAQIAAIKNNPAVQKVALKFDDPNNTARAFYYRLNDQSDGVLEFEQMPTLPAGKQYQLWLIDSQSPRPYAAFNADSGTLTSLLVHKDAKTAAYNTVALTIEPTGGSSTPSDKPVAVGQF